MYSNNVEWSNLTFMFYCALIIISSLTTQLSNKYLKLRNKRCNITIVLLTIILILIKVFNTTGRDISVIGGYQYNFYSATSMNNFMDQGVEFGFKILTVIIRHVTSDFNCYLVILGIMYILPIIYMLNKYRENIDLFSTVLFYFTVFLFPSFSPLRQCLAASIGLLAFDKMVEKKAAQCIFWLIIAVMFHSSALVLVIPFFCVFFKAMNRKMITFMIILIFTAFMVVKNSIFSFFLGNSRYIGYSMAGNGIGLEQIVYFAPIVALIIYNRKNMENHYVKINYAYVFSAFCFGLLSYIITVFGRLYITYLPLMFIIGFNIKTLKSTNSKYKWLINLIICLYCSLRFWMYISRYYNLENLMPYTNLLGWII